MHGVLCGNCDAKKALKCNKNCVLKTMESFEKYLVYINTLKAEIGKFSPVGKDGGYTISGVYRSKGDYSTGKYLCDLSKGIVIPVHFDKYMNISIHKLVDEYIAEKYDGKDSEVVAELRDIMVNRVVELNSGKQVITPFNLDDVVRFKDSNGKEVTGLVTKLSFRRDTDTCKIYGEVIVHLENCFKTGRSAKLRFRDFDKEWCLDAMPKKKDLDLIEMTDEGVILPIEIIGHGNESIIIDNQYIYNYSSYGYEIVGCESGGKYKIDTKKYELPKDIMKVIEDNIERISVVQKYIGVYGIHQTKEVKLYEE